MSELDRRVALHIDMRVGYGWSEQEIMNDLVALALVLAAHDIERPNRTANSLTQKVGATDRKSVV